MSKSIKYFITILFFFVKVAVVTSFISFILFEIISFKAESESLIFFNGSFLGWFTDALRLDFGTNGAGYPILEDILSALRVSSKYISLSVLCALFFAIILLYLSKIFYIKNTIGPIFLSLGFIHLIYLYEMFMDIPFIPSDFLMVFSLAIGSGVFYDFYLLLSKAYENIINKDYSIFANISGYNPHKFALKELLISTVSIVVSRLPILFGGMVIIEVFTNGIRDYNGIGLRIWQALKEARPPDYELAFSASVVSVFIFSFIYFYSEYLMQRFDPKAKE